MPHFSLPSQSVNGITGGRIDIRAEEWPKLGINPNEVKKVGLRKNWVAKIKEGWLINNNGNLSVNSHLDDNTRDYDVLPHSWWKFVIVTNNSNQTVKAPAFPRDETETVTVHAPLPAKQPVRQTVFQ